MTDKEAHITAALAIVVRARLEGMLASARRELFEELTRGYCTACGNRILAGRTCHCEEDE